LDVRHQGSVAVRRGPATLGQILDILVDNATTHGGGSVEVAASIVSGGISIGVHDEGDGMIQLPTLVPAEVSATSGSSAESTEGGRAGANGDGSHGLGLRLAQSLAEAAGGRLVLKSSGPGPLVAVILP
jgi:signal transduction histidine kinase